MFGLDFSDILIFLIWICSPILAGIIASKRGRNVIGWTLLTLLFCPAILVLLCIPPVKNGETTSSDKPFENDTHECPFCAERIKIKAIVCKHCGKDVSQAHNEI